MARFSGLLSSALAMARWSLKIGWAVLADDWYPAYCKETLHWPTGARYLLKRVVIESDLSHYRSGLLFVRP